MKPLAFALALAVLGALVNAAPRALPEGALPEDKRFADLKDLNGYFPFTPPTSKEQWATRSAQIRHALMVSVGLFPEPERTPLNPVIHGKIDGGDFTVEKVYFETRPGFLLTGSLYRPKNRKGKSPGVLCPHGHWNEARFFDAGGDNARQLVKDGAEENVESARNHIQSRCVGLARLGCTVLQYDMLGYCDNDQISYQLAHRFAKQRPGMIGQNRWGLFSPQAESHLQSIMMLQTWNSMRAIDFLQSLPEVDPERIAVTGASGGGTQTFVISALDPRVKVSMPAVMVSTAMQGGCTCENSTLMRVTEGNVAFAALFAPKPL
ncbi:MAG: acetylxylan esterase, partial [Akkermansiaceae bacterium]